MKKKIYFKEKWDRILSDDKKHKTYVCEIYWKRFHFIPFMKKMNGTYDALSARTLYLKYCATYDVYVWDEVFSQFVPLKYMM